MKECKIKTGITVVKGPNRRNVCFNSGEDIMPAGTGKLLGLENDAATVSPVDAPEHDSSKDTPWSLVVALACFLSQGILGGHVYTTGMFYTVFRQTFAESSEVGISWLCTMPLTLWFIASPIGSILVNRYGCRTCSLIGGLFASAGLALCYFTTNFYLIFLLYGVLAGCGNGIQYVGFVTAVSRYFQKYRAIANIITTIGLTFGMAVYAMLVPHLMSNYGWQGSLFILGAMSANLCALACPLFPTHSTPSGTKLINIQLLKNKHLLLFALHLMMCNMASGVLFLHLPALIISYDIGVHVSALSLTIYGTSNCFAKIVFSIVGYVCNPDSGIVYTVSLFIFGFGMILLAAYPVQIWILTFVAILGFTYSVSGGHYLEVVFGLVGQENVSDGLGFGQVAKAVGSLLAGPLAGTLYEYTTSYRTSFFTGGALMTIGCIIMIPVNIKLKRNLIRNEANNQTTCIVFAPVPVKESPT